MLVLMGGYICAHCWSGKLRPEARSTLDNTAIFWHYVTAQGIAAMAIVSLMPQI